MQAHALNNAALQLPVTDYLVVGAQKVITVGMGLFKDLGRCP